MGLWKQWRFCFLILFAILGIIRGIFWQPDVPTQWLNRVVSVCGTVGFPSALYSSGASVVLKQVKLNQMPISGKLNLFIPKKQPVFKEMISVGSSYCFQGTIQGISNFGIPGEFDQERYFLSRGIWGKLSMTPKTKIAFGPPENGLWIQKMRERLAHFFDPFPSGFLVQAMTLGLKHNIPQEIEESFIRSGLIHLLVISGQNISLMLTGFLCFAFMWSHHFHHQKKILLLMLCFLILFCIFSGGDFPVIRAGVMMTAYLATLWHSRFHSVWYGCLWGLVLILNFLPSSLFDPSFQLSFLAMVGLLMIPPSLKKNPFQLLFSAPLFAIIMTAPLVAFHFQRFSWIALLSNLICSPLVTIAILPLAYLISALYFVAPILAGGLLELTEPLFQLFIRVSQFLGSGSWSSQMVLAPTVHQLIIIYIFIFAALFLWRRKSFLKIFCLLLICLPSFFLPLKTEEPLKISFLSVGQGDATFIEFPNGKTMFIDGGGMFGSFDAGERLLGPYLRKKQLRRIDILVMSHDDLDHIEGFKHLLETFEVKSIWTSQVQGKPLFYELATIADQKNIPYRLVSEKTSPLMIGGVKCEFFNPQGLSTMSHNNMSQVMRLSYKNHSVLFTGDIEREVEERLVREVGDHLKSNVLKVPHHGSKTSSSRSFLRAVSPQLAVLSSGRYNRYGHPHREVLERYHDLGISVWQTARQGTRVIEFGLE